MGAYQTVCLPTLLDLESGNADERKTGQWFSQAALGNRPALLLLSGRIVLKCVDALQHRWMRIVQKNIQGMRQ